MSRKINDKLYYLLLLSPYITLAGMICIHDGTFSEQKPRKKIKKQLNLTNDSFKFVKCMFQGDIIISTTDNRKNVVSNVHIHYNMIKAKYETRLEKYIAVDINQSIKDITYGT
jgi:hypothetical protein